MLLRLLLAVAVALLLLAVVPVANATTFPTTTSIISISTSTSRSTSKSRLGSLAFQQPSVVCFHSKNHQQAKHENKNPWLGTFQNPKNFRIKQQQQQQRQQQQQYSQSTISIFAMQGSAETNPSSQSSSQSSLQPPTQKPFLARCVEVWIGILLRCCLLAKRVKQLSVNVQAKSNRHVLQGNLESFQINIQNSCGLLLHLNQLDIQLLPSLSSQQQQQKISVSSSSSSMISLGLWPLVLTFGIPILFWKLKVIHILYGIICLWYYLLLLQNNMNNQQPQKSFLKTTVQMIKNLFPKKIKYMLLKSLNGSPFSIHYKLQLTNENIQQSRMIQFYLTSILRSLMFNSVLGVAAMAGDTMTMFQQQQQQQQSQQQQSKQQSQQQNSDKTIFAKFIGSNALQLPPGKTDNNNNDNNKETKRNTNDFYKNLNQDSTTDTVNNASNSSSSSSLVQSSSLSSSLSLSKENTSRVDETKSSTTTNNNNNNNNNNNFVPPNEPKLLKLLQATDFVLTDTSFSKYGHLVMNANAIFEKSKNNNKTTTTTTNNNRLGDDDSKFSYTLRVTPRPIVLQDNNNNNDDDTLWSIQQRQQQQSQYGLVFDNPECRFATSVMIMGGANNNNPSSPSKKRNKFLERFLPDLWIPVGPGVAIPLGKYHCISNIQIKNDNNTNNNNNNDDEDNNNNNNRICEMTGRISMFHPSPSPTEEVKNL